MRPRRTESPQCQAISCFQGNLIKVTPLKPTGFWLALRDSSNFRRGTGTKFVKKINTDQVRFQTSIEFQVHFQYQNFSSNSAPWFCSVVTWKTDLLNKSNSQARPWMWSWPSLIPQFNCRPLDTCEWHFFHVIPNDMIRIVFVSPAPYGRPKDFFRSWVQCKSSWWY